MKFIFFLPTFFLIHCATIINSPSAKIKVESEPEDLKIFLDEKEYDCNTPCSISIKRNSVHTIRVIYSETEKEDYDIDKEVSLWVFGNLLFGIWGLAGLGLDYYIGSMYYPSKEKIFANFQKPEETKKEEPTPEEKEFEPPAKILDQIPEKDLREIQELYSKDDINQQIKNYLGEIESQKIPHIQAEIYFILYQMKKAGEKLDIDQAFKVYLLQ